METVLNEMETKPCGFTLKSVEQTITGHPGSCPKADFAFSLLFCSHRLMLGWPREAPC